MPMPADFERESLYAPDAWFLDDVEVIDAEQDRVVGVLDTSRLTWWAERQRPWQGHPAHVPAAITIQMTATLAQLHVIYVLGRRSTDGWIGWGTHVRKARFPNPALIGPPVRAEVVATRVRSIRGTLFVDYRFHFEQEGTVIYQSEQTAAWTRGEQQGPCVETATAG